MSYSNGKIESCQFVALSNGSVKGNYESATGGRESAEPGVPHRARGSAAARLGLSTAYITPSRVSPAIKIDNSSVKVAAQPVNRFLEDEIDTEHGKMPIVYNGQIPNPANVAPVYVPRMDGSVKIWDGGSLIQAKRPNLRKLGNLHAKGVSDQSIEAWRKECMAAYAEGRPVAPMRSGGGIRGRVRGFSRQSRKRMLDTMGKFRNDTVALFVTLTYPGEWSHDSKVWKRDLDTFLKRLLRKFPQAAGLWRLEPQKRGAPHFHLLLFNVDYLPFLRWCSLAWYEVVGSGDERHLHAGTRVEAMRTWQGVKSYAAKYLGKLAEEQDSHGWDYPGRWWGLFGLANIPWADCIELALPVAETKLLIRIMRKYVGEKFNGRDFCSLSISVNNASWWLDRLPDIVGWGS